MKNFEIPDGIENLEGLLLITHIIEASGSQEKSQGDIGIRISRGVERQHLAFPFPGKQLVIPDLKIPLSPSPYFLECFAVVRPHRPQHRVALPFGGRHALLIEADDPSFADICLPVKTPERRKVVQLTDIPVAGRRGGFRVSRDADERKQTKEHERCDLRQAAIQHGLRSWHERRIKAQQGFPGNSGTPLDRPSRRLCAIQVQRGDDAMMARCRTPANNRACHVRSSPSEQTRMAAGRRRTCP